MNELYFESLKTDYRHDYLTSNPKKGDVLKNARHAGNAFILGGSNNRALIITDGDRVYLQSYDTLILCINRVTGEINKLWYGYSVTTLKHVNAFMQSYNGQQFNKAAWLAFKGVCA